MQTRFIFMQKSLQYFELKISRSTALLLKDMMLLDALRLQPHVPSANEQ